ncbi:Cytochrome b [Rubrivivax sp. A210]|uniref:cytochrome b n=1 Tax=Rubrivivax sp. A210 TaxID=2772301 RepID=UPI001919972A|nr:cytochrome b [Rubrivivax sp. A210]CAD5374984.1 Cytochrome b [Rubrivivax sp. A210]
MTTHSTPIQRYDGVAIAAHWLLALLIIGNLALGVYMHDLPLTPARLKLFNYHKWAGVMVLALSALRLLWRLTHRPPAEPAMPAWQAHAAQAVHLLLYVSFFALPLSGWAYSSASGFPIVLFGVLPLPDFVGPDRALADSFKLLHKLLAFGLAGLVALHVAAALKHQFFDGDGLLLRMLPGRRSR